MAWLNKLKRQNAKGKSQMAKVKWSRDLDFEFCVSPFAFAAFASPVMAADHPTPGLGL
jgi:hypothetical protein